MDKDEIIPVLAAIPCLALLILLFIKLLTPIPFTGVVDSRWWEWYRAYEYESCYWTISPDTDGEGFRTEEHCSTHTRCYSRTSGTERELVKPELPCSPHYGDDEVNNIDYYFVYHEEDGERKKLSFNGDYWDEVEVGHVVKGKRVIGIAKDLEKVK